MCRSLIGDNIRDTFSFKKLGSYRSSIGNDTDTEGFFFTKALVNPFQCLIYGVGDPIQITIIYLLLRFFSIDFGYKYACVIHSSCKRLRFAHVTEPGSKNPFTGQTRGFEMFSRAGVEGLIGALKNSLWSGVAPAPCSHLPVHCESHQIQPIECFLIGLTGHKVAVSDNNPGCPRVCLRYVDRLPGLNTQCLVRF